MNVDNKNIIPKLSEKDTAKLKPVTVGRKFGRDDEDDRGHDTGSVVTAVDWHPSQALLLSADSEGKVILWKPSRFK